MSHTHLQRLFLPLIFIFLIGCYQSPPFVYIGGEPEPVVPGEDHRCVNYDDSENLELTLFEAINARNDAALFAEWMRWLANEDFQFNRVVNEFNSKFTLLVPSNEAIIAFSQEYNFDQLSENQKYSLIKHHVLMAYLPYESFVGQGIAPGMNREPVNYKVEDQHCVIFNDRSLMVTANDECSNGLLHMIDQVLVPSRGF